MVEEVCIRFIVQVSASKDWYAALSRRNNSPMLVHLSSGPGDGW